MFSFFSWKAGCTVSKGLWSWVFLPVLVSLAVGRTEITAGTEWASSLLGVREPLGVGSKWELQVCSGNRKTFLNDWVVRFYASLYKWQEVSLFGLLGPAAIWGWQTRAQLAQLYVLLPFSPLSTLVLFLLGQLCSWCYWNCPFSLELCTELTHVPFWKKIKMKAVEMVKAQNRFHLQATLI